MLLTLPANLVVRPLSRARQVRPDGVAAKRRAAGSDRSGSSSRSPRSAACSRWRLPMSRCKYCSRSSSLPIDAPRLFPFLRPRPPSRIAIPRAGASGSSAAALPFAVANVTELALAQRAGAAGQCDGLRSRGGGAMGPDPCDRRACCAVSASRSRFRSAPNSATTMRSATRSGCAGSMPRARCSSPSWPA